MYLLDIAPVAHDRIIGEGSNAAVGNFVKVIYCSKSEVRIWSCTVAEGMVVMLSQSLCDDQFIGYFPKSQLLSVFKFKLHALCDGRKRLPFQQPHI